MKKVFIFALILTSFFLTSLFNPSQVFAQIQNPFLSNFLQGLSGGEFLARLLPALITLLFVVGAIIFIFMFMLGAIQWITSGGDKAQTETAGKRITNALIGLTILFSLFAIIKLIETFFGISITVFNINDYAI